MANESDKRPKKQPYMSVFPGMQPRKTPYLSVMQVPDYTPQGYAREALNLFPLESIDRTRKRLFGSHNPGRKSII